MRSYPFRRTIHVLMTSLLFMASAFAGDISVLSDFANSEFLHEEAFLTQTGNSNIASVDQGIDSGGTVGHYAEITQTGTGNQAYTVQTGDLNRVRINQNGSDNYASTTQNGFRNLIDLVQTGQGNIFSATQNGNDNSIVESQSGGKQANLAETGNNNSIIVDQSPGSQISVNVNLVGNGMSLTIN